MSESTVKNETKAYDLAAMQKDVATFDAFMCGRTLSLSEPILTLVTRINAGMLNPTIRQNLESAERHIAIRARRVGHAQREVAKRTSIRASEFTA